MVGAVCKNNISIDNHLIGSIGHDQTVPYSIGYRNMQVAPYRKTVAVNHQFMKWLDKQVELINPEFIATLGRFSMNKFLPGVFISQAHGQARWANFNKKKYLIFPLYHPAAALRNGNVMREFKKDFAKLKELMDNKEKVEILRQFEKEEKPEKEEKEQLSLL